MTPMMHDDRLIPFLIEISSAIGDLSRAIGTHPDEFLNRVYPPFLSRDELLAQCHACPELGRPDTAVSVSPDGSLEAIPYPDLFPELRANILIRISRALPHSTHPPMTDYLLGVARYFETPAFSNYLDMSALWMSTIDLPVIMPVVSDETYCDSRCGLKGTVDSAVFIADSQLTETLSLPSRSWASFLKRLPIAVDALPVAGMSSRVYRTAALDGALPNMKLRAWNLPNPHDVRRIKGTHQIIIYENTRSAFESDLKPALRRIFNSLTVRHTDDMLFDGLIRTLSAHELGHNYACFANARSLNDRHDTFEEMKANILPLLWVCFCLESGLMALDDAVAAICVYLALDLQDCILARETLSRRCYCLATALQMNYMLEHDAISIDNGDIRIDLNAIWNSNLDLLRICMAIMANGDRDSADRLIHSYGSISPYQKTLDRMIAASGSV